MIHMAKGGARNRSGPPKDPNSLKSGLLGITLTELAPYTGRAPGLNAYLPKPTARHRAVWVELWRTPQASAWSLDRWRWPIVADLTRRMVQAEDPDSPIGVATAIRQLRDDLGLSEAGMKQLGWTIKRDELAPKRAAKKTAAAPVSARDRMKVVSGGLDA
jgi:hypothetical protein